MNFYLNDHPWASFLNWATMKAHFLYAYASYKIHYGIRILYRARTMPLRFFFKSLTSGVAEVAFGGMKTLFFHKN